MKYILTLILTIASAFAENIYVSQNGAGSKNGSSAANAAAMTWFNTSGNWNTAAASDGKIGPGDIVHFTGTITSQAFVQGSGTAASRITLRIDPGAKFTSPCWPVNGAISGTDKSNIILEGSNPQAGDGVIAQTDIENTNNGTALGLQTDQSRHIYFEGSGTNITIRNLVSRNVYVRTYNHPSDLAGGGTNISLRGGGNLLIENCYMDNSESGCTIGGTAPVNDNLVVNNNWVTDCANGIKIATIAPGNIVQNVRITRNRIDHLARWGNGGNPGGYHNDGIQTIADPAGSLIREMHIAYNHIGPRVSDPGDTSMTDLIFIAGNCTGCYVYNNFLELGLNNYMSNPVIGVGNSPAESGSPNAKAHLIANNTIMGGGVSTGTHLGYGNFVGNITYKMRSYNDFHNAPASNPALNTKADYNIYFGSTDPGGSFIIRSGSGAGEGAFPWWQGRGFDSHGANVDPMLNSNGTLKAGSPAIGFAPTQTVFNDDFYGNPRTPPWDAGAFETGGGIVPTPTPTPSATPTPAPTATPGPTPPPPVVSFALQWNAVQYATSFRVFEDNVQIAEVTTFTYSLAGKVGPKVYTVRAVNASGQSQPSNSVTLPAPPSPTPTPQPTPSPTATPVPVPAAPVLEIREQAID